MTQANEADAKFMVPQAIDDVIARFDASKGAIDRHKVKQAVAAARNALANPSEAEKEGAWTEVLAFALDEDASGRGPWGTYFGPYGSRTNKDGTIFYAPDIAGTSPLAIAHWTHRAKSLTHPALKARYADLAWDMARAIANAKPDAEMARTAIDSYLDSLTAKLQPDAHSAFDAANRALALAQTLRDTTRVDAARGALLALHREAVAANDGLWWIAPDRLLEDRKAALTDGERDRLVADLEAVVARRAATDPGVFDPHAVEAAAKRLIKHYIGRGLEDDAKRLHAVIGRAFEHAASLGAAMVASSFLQTSVNAYQKAGLADESKRARIEMEKKIAASHEEAATFTFEQTITKEDMETFLAGVVTGSPGQTFANIACAFLQSREELEKQIAAVKEQSPLMAAIGQTVIAENHVAAKVGSVDEDPFGRLIRQAMQSMSFSDIWLVSALRKAIETHDARPGHFVGWAARGGLFEDLTLLMEGVVAWYAQDYVKAVHVLVPQVEKGLRAVAAKLGQPMTKPHRAVKGVGVAVGMGDILYKDETRNTLGPELTIHFLTLYADPRGFNLRNEVAHGLLAANAIHEGLVARIIHTLLVFGIWQEISKVRGTAAGSVQA